MRFQLLISCNNEAFAEDAIEDEVARILGEAKRAVADSAYAEGTLRDINGNTVGNWAFIADEPE